VTGPGDLIVLDRDGVLNRLVAREPGVPPESPIADGEVAILPGVPAALRRLTDAGFVLAVASNQPAAAKGKLTRDAIHARIVAEAESAGGRIARSFICYHRAEDGCDCRKPRPGLLRDALAAFPGTSAERAWIVGDRATDVLAGQALGFSTALVGATWPEDEELFRTRGFPPSFRGRDLQHFVEFLLRSPADAR